MSHRIDRGGRVPPVEPVRMSFKEARQRVREEHKKLDEEAAREGEEGGNRYDGPKSHPGGDIHNRIDKVKK